MNSAYFWIEALESAAGDYSEFDKKLGYGAAAKLQKMQEALESIVECCEEDHCARDYASRQSEIRAIAKFALNT